MTSFSYRIYSLIWVWDRLCLPCYWGIRCSSLLLSCDLPEVSHSVWVNVRQYKDSCCTRTVFHFCLERKHKTKSPKECHSVVPVCQHAATTLHLSQDKCHTRLVIGSQPAELVPLSRAWRWCAHCTTCSRHWHSSWALCVWSVWEALMPPCGQ